MKDNFKKEDFEKLKEIVENQNKQAELTMLINSYIMPMVEDKLKKYGK